MSSLRNMIYIYHAEGTDLYKVGYTSRRNAARRRKEWETGCPYPLVLIGTVEGSLADEKAIHDRLKLHGKWASEAAGQEWFRLTPRDIEQILGRAPLTFQERLTTAAFEFGEKQLKRKVNNVSRRKGLQGIAGQVLKSILKRR